MKTNLVIATWSGLRSDGRIESQDKYFAKDRSVYIRAQIHQLSTLQHNLDQITIAVPKNTNEPKEFTQFINKIPCEIKNTPVKIIRRSNVGHSYGSFNSVYEKYRNQFDFYILLEDDYVFVLDYFDEILIKIIQRKGGDLLATDIVPGPYNIPHAPLTNAMCRTTALEKIYNYFGHLPHGTTPAHKWKNRQIRKAPFSYSQLAFNYAFIELGLKMIGMRYMTVRWGLKSVEYCCNKPNPDNIIIAPVQLLIDPINYKHKSFPRDWPKWKPLNPIRMFL